MKRITILALAVLSLSGCGVWNRTVAGFKEYTRTCVGGVSYLQFPSGASVEFDKNGKVVACE